jgi:Alkylmercury lyase
MTRRNATIDSVDPDSGEPIDIRYHNGSWTWMPNTTVVLVAGTGGCTTAAQAACRYVQFFTDSDHAAAHLRANPTLTGATYRQADSLETARIIFGALLDD